MPAASYLTRGGTSKGCVYALNQAVVRPHVSLTSGHTLCNVVQPSCVVHCHATLMSCAMSCTSHVLCNVMQPSCVVQCYAHLICCPMSCSPHVLCNVMHISCVVQCHATLTCDAMSCTSHVLCIVMQPSCVVQCHAHLMCCAMSCSPHVLCMVCRRGQGGCLFRSWHSQWGKQGSGQSTCQLWGGNL